MFARLEARGAVPFWEIAMHWFGRLALIASLTVMGCLPATSVNAEVTAHPDKKCAQIEYFLRTPVGVGPTPIKQCFMLTP
jgi:hypothetical protein